MLALVLFATSAFAAPSCPFGFTGEKPQSADEAGVVHADPYAAGGDTGTAMGGMGMGNGQSSAEFGLSAARRFAPGIEASLAVSREARFFETDAPVADHEVRANFTHPYIGRNPVELGGSYSPNANFLPQWSVRMTPHWLFDGGGNLAVITGYEGRKANGAFVMGLGYASPLDGLDGTVGLSGTVTAASQVVTAGNAFVDWWELSKLGVHIAFSAGEALEDATRADTFISVTPTIRYRVSPTLVARFDGEHYRSDLRRETRMSFGVDWTY